MSVQWKTVAQVTACVGAAAMFGLAPIAMKAQAPAAGGGRGGAAPTVGTMLWPAFDANKDGSVNAAEITSAFDKWYDAADAQKSGSVSQEQLTTAINAALGQPAEPAGGGAGAGRGGGRGAGGGRAAAPFVAGAPTPGLDSPCGGRSQEPTAPCPSDVQQMEAILPAT